MKKINKIHFLIICFSLLSISLIVAVPTFNLLSGDAKMLIGEDELGFDDGTNISAFIGDEIRGSGLINDESGYVLNIDGTNEDDGKNVVFKMGDVFADQILIYSSMDDDEFDLTITDADGDDYYKGYEGYDGSDRDCDDTNSEINPNAVEKCDEVDNDCDGVVDEDCSKIIEDIITEGVENLNLTVGNSDDLTQSFTGINDVEVKDGTEVLIEFSYDFSEGTLNLTDMVVSSSDSSYGEIIITGLDLQTGQTKTVYITKVASAGKVCIKDEDNLASISGLATSACTGTNEYLVSCNGVTTVEGYTCTSVGSKYKVEGLKHSGVIENSYTAPTSTTTSSSGGGGSSCYTEWECTGWNNCIDGEQTRDCLKIKPSCKVREDQPIEIQTCVVSEEESEKIMINTENTAELNTSPGITGAVIGFVKTGRGIVSIIFVLGIVGAFVGVRTFRKRRK